MTVNPDQRIAVVIGSSSGIGYETSLLLARNGYYTYATVRKLDDGSKHITDIAEKENLSLETIQLDVNDEKSVKEGINKISDEKERIDVAVNNAGFDLMGPLEETSMEEIKAQFETNFFGIIRVMQAVIPIMREQRSGRIVNIASMGGRIAVPFHSGYHGTKFAVEGLSESTRYELEPFGIKTILIEPGAVGSSFWRNMKKAAKTSSLDNDSPYKQMANNMSEAQKQMAQNSMHPSEVAKLILQAVTSDNPDFRYVVGKDAAMTLEARRNMSDRDFDNLIKKQLNL